MGADEVHVGDKDTKFLATIYDKDADGVSQIVNISTANPKQIIFKKPDGSILIKDGTFETDGTDGKLYYKLIEGDITAVGMWEWQGEVTIGAAFNHSDTKSFEVFKNLR